MIGEISLRECSQHVWRLFFVYALTFGVERHDTF
jgi:nitrate/nitrite transporter NarK